MEPYSTSILAIANCAKPEKLLNSPSSTNLLIFTTLSGSIVILTTVFAI